MTVKYLIPVSAGKDMHFQGAMPKTHSGLPPTWHSRTFAGSESMTSYHMQSQSRGVMHHATECLKFASASLKVQITCQLCIREFNFCVFQQLCSILPGTRGSGSVTLRWPHRLVADYGTGTLGQKATKFHVKCR